MLRQVFYGYLYEEICISNLTKRVCSGVFLGSQHKICLQAQVVIVWPEMRIRHWYTMVDSFMVSQVLQEMNLTIVFMVHSLSWCLDCWRYVFWSKSMVKISMLAQLATMFMVKGSRSSKNKSWAWKYIEVGNMVSFGYHSCKIRKRYSGNSAWIMWNWKISLWISICFSSGVYPCNMEEKVMSHVLYASWKYKVCDGKVWYVQVSYISHAVGVVSGHMTNPCKGVKLGASVS